MPETDRTQPQPAPGGPGPAQPPGPARLPEQTIDLQALAKKVYALLVKEAQLERDRR